MEYRALFSTLRFRITVLYVLVFGILLWTFSAMLYIVYKGNLASDFDAFLYNRALGIARSISVNTQGELEINQSLIAESGKLFPFQFGNEYIELRDVKGKSLAHTGNLTSNSLSLGKEILQQVQQEHFVYITIPNSQEIPFWGKGNLRLLTMPLIARGKIQLILQLGVSTHAYDHSLGRLRTVLFYIGIPITLLLAGTGGWWLAGRAFDPINRIVSAAQKLGTERLEGRLPVPEAEDELRRLSLTLNEMLDRLERAFKSQQRFVADASHELKTPLTILQGELDVLKQQPRSPEEYKTFLASASEELHRLSQIIHNLLLLAQADAGRKVKVAPIRVDEVVMEVIERLQRFAQKDQVKLCFKIDQSLESSPESLTISGDPDLLASLFFNLIHNAIKYSASGQTVEIQFSTRDHQLYVSVKDFGTGIRAEEIPHIFERFHRAENPKHSEVTGTGLGLAIAQWIAEAHRAVIKVESKPAEGSVFSVVFPRSL
jgi:signal transduction histidine kinase